MILPQTRPDLALSGPQYYRLLKNQMASGYQPLDPDLTAIAALTTSSFGRGLLTQGDATSARSYLGAGTGTGSGTVTDFSAGDLSPLFTTSEATTTTTPALTFALSNAAANTFFGNGTGGSAAPTFMSASTARTALGLVIGTNVQAYDATLAALAALTIAADSLTIGTGADAFSQTSFAANTFPAKSSTGNLVAKTITDFGLSLVDDASASNARTTLGLVIGTDVQAYDSDLTTIAGLTATTDNFLVSVASAWASRTPAQVRATLALVIGTNVQAWDTDLDTWATVTRASGLDTFVATPSSANLLALLTTKTGTGNNVFATSPTLVTPLLGTPTSGNLSNCTNYAYSSLTGTPTISTNSAPANTVPVSNGTNLVSSHILDDGTDVTIQPAGDATLSPSGSVQLKPRFNGVNIEPTTGEVFIRNLPSLDPGVSGQLWSDPITNILMISP